LKIPRTYGTRYWGFKFTLAPLPQKNFNAWMQTFLGIVWITTDSTSITFCNLVKLHL
jgi:hypothetical protein